MSVFTVGDIGTLNSTLALAQPGDTIALVAGSYSGLTIKNLALGGITITSADPLAPAVVTDLTVVNSSGITFSNLELTPNADTAFKVSASQDVHFDHLDVHGSLDGNPQDDPIAFLIRSSTNVSVTNSEFQQLHHALEHLDDDGLTISGNNFHDIQIDAVRGGGSSDVVVSNNTFRNFFPETGDHGDAIQFWTTNTTTSAHDITVTGNVFVRGAGQVAQGIFLGDEVGHPYQHVVISDNAIIGGMYNGIAVGGGNDVTITDNVVAGFSDMKSWIRLNHVTDATLSNNSANVYLIDATNTAITQTGDVTAPLATDAGASVLANWSATHSLTIPLDNPTTGNPVPNDPGLGLEDSVPAITGYGWVLL